MPEPVTLASTKKLIGMLSFYALSTAGLVCTPQRAIAQTYVPSDRVPIADGSMNTQVSGSGNSFDITGGVTRGQTLFHSFSDFSVPTNGAANFLNPGGSRDIITRVTGSSFSDINGLVNSNGANFFLINPNGVVFGTNASLNVGQVFVASTANSIDLVDGSGRAITFGTNRSGDAALLTVAPNVLFDVSRLNFGGGIAQVTNYGVLQTANFNQYIGLFGGNITLDGGRIRVDEDLSRVELGGLSASGSIDLTRDGGTLKAQFPIDVDRADVSVLNTSLVNLRNGEGGDIFITARNLEVSNASRLQTGIFNDFGGPERVAGDIKIVATGDISVANGGRISNLVGPGAIGQGGGIEIEAGKNISIVGDSSIVTATLGIGSAGNVQIKAAENFFLNFSGVSSVVFGGTGNGGTVKIAAGRNIKIDNESVVQSDISETGIGKGGSLEISAGGDLVFADNSSIRTTSLGQGDAGNISIAIKGNILFSNTVDISSEVLEAVGNSGRIEITAGQDLVAVNNAFLSSASTGQGDAGQVKITTGGNVKFDNSFISSAIGLTGIGNGGGVEITAGQNLSITNDSQLTSSSLGQGTAGSISLQANTIGLENGAVFSNSTIFPGGNVQVTSNDFLLLNRNSTIATNSSSTDINGNGGNITINSPLIVAPPGNNDITANAVQGNGGRVNITSQGLFGIQFRQFGSTTSNDITVSSTFGQQGAATIVTPGTDPGRDSPELPSVPTDSSSQISQACDSSARVNKFTISGRGGLPPNAGDLLNSDVVWQDTRGVQSQPPIGRSPTPGSQPPSPAVTMTFDGKGKATLVAAGTSDRTVKLRSTCPQKPN